MSNPTQQTIDVGAVANDGTGESLRDAFTAVNNNFANVWAAGPVGTNVVIANNQVTTNVTNLDLKLAGNGVGNVVVASTMQPTIDGVYDLGRPDRRFGEVHADYYYGNGAFLSDIDAFSTIDANGVVISANANTTVTFAPGNNISILANASSSTIDIAVDSAPTFDSITANTAEISVQANIETVVSNSVTANSLATTTANVGNIAITDNQITSINANANIVLSPNGIGVVESTANIVAPYFIGNIVGNISGNIAAPGANTEIIFNDGGQANAVPALSFNKTTSALSVAGNITGANLNGAGYGIAHVMADRGGDTTNWNVLVQMGTYTVNRTNWGGVTGAPVDCPVYVGLLEVKTANTQGSIVSVQQSFFPGTVTQDNKKIQFNRSLWEGSWTAWIKITNDGQDIDGGSF